MLLLYLSCESCKETLTHPRQTKEITPYKFGLVRQLVSWNCLEEAGRLRHLHCEKRHLSMGISVVPMLVSPVSLQLNRTEENDIWNLQEVSNDPSPLLL